MRQNNAGKPVPRSLRAGVQTHASGGQHQCLQKHTVIHQRAATHHFVQREHQADWRIKKPVIALVLRVHFVFVTFGDAEQAIKAPAVFAASVDERTDPLFRVIVVGLAVIGRYLRVRSDIVVRDTDFFYQCVPAVALQHIDLPRLCVGAGRGASGLRQQFCQKLARYRLLSEGTR